jgi:hypothetical protein
MVRTGRPPRTCLVRRVARIAEAAAGYVLNILLATAALTAALT